MYVFILYGVKWRIGPDGANFTLSKGKHQSIKHNNATKQNTDLLRQ